MGKGNKGVVLKLPKEGPDGREVCPLERPSKRGAASPGEGLGDRWPQGGRCCRACPQHHRKRPRVVQMVFSSL